jgi:hypothetical protein
VSDAEIAALNIKRAEFHGEWNSKLRVYFLTNPKRKDPPGRDTRKTAQEPDQDRGRQRCEHGEIARIGYSDEPTPHSTDPFPPRGTIILSLWQSTMPPVRPLQKAVAQPSATAGCE